MGWSFREIARRFTGFSTPVFGVSWTPPVSEREAVIRIFAFLEDRRALYHPYNIETPQWVVDSILQTRKYLVEETGQFAPSSELRESIQAMLQACRKFLDHVERLGPLNRRSMFWPPFNSEGQEFFTALGELRGTFGVHIATLSTKYGVDVGEELGTILPFANSDEDS